MKALVQNLQIGSRAGVRITLILFLLLVVIFTFMLSVDFDKFSLWVLNKQRWFQTQMSSSLFALRSSEISAYLALFAATGGYGFVHALGPGHGKYLVGGVGLGSAVSTVKLLGLAIASSLLQAIWAIVLVYGGFALLSVSAENLQFLSEDVLAPASYVAIGLVGLILAWRGARALAKRTKAAEHAHAHDHRHHDENCGCGHSHGPTPEEVAKVGSVKEAIALITSIAIRPCTGAVFLLIVAWQADILLAGALAVMVMGLGTAALTSIVAVSSVAARQLAFFSADASGVASIAVPAVQILAGVLICWISFGLLLFIL